MLKLGVMMGDLRKSIQCAVMAVAILSFSSILSALNAQAGDIVVEIRGGHLFVFGSNDSSSITITSAGDAITVTGHSTFEDGATRVNDIDDGAVTLSGWTKGISVFTYAGNDTVMIRDVISNGPVLVNLGAGDDRLLVGSNPESEALLNAMPIADPVAAAMLFEDSPVTIRSKLAVYGGSGSDDVVMRTTRVDAITILDLGTGDDFFFAGGTSTPQTAFGNNVLILPGPGADGVNLDSLTLDKNLVVDDADGPLQFSASNTEVAISSYVYATAQDDLISGSNWNMGDFLLVVSENGNDKISYTGTSSNSTFDAGGGNDQVELYDMDSGNVNVLLGQGNDQIWLSSSAVNRVDIRGGVGDDFFKIRSTIAQRANVFGDSGFDSVQSSTLFPNAIARYTQNSIEAETVSSR